METEASALDLHTLHSSYRERLLEHLLIGELMKHLWLDRKRRMEVLRPQVDDGGYDLVLCANGVIRFVQLKASRASGRTAHIQVAASLWQKPRACVIWMQFDDDFKLEPFWWYACGEEVPETLPTGRHTRRNSAGERSERPGIRIVRKALFQKLEGIPALADALFGKVPTC